MDAHNIPPSVEASPLIVQCVSRSALHFGINPLLVQAILNVEGNGKIVKNSNGTNDYGKMAINDVKFPEVKKRFPTVTKRDLVNNGCINVAVGTWVLSDHVESSGSMWKALAWYNSKTPGVGDKYRAKVIREYQKLIRDPRAIFVYKGALRDYLKMAESGRAVTFDKLVVKR